MSDKSLKPLTKSRFKIGHECPRKLYYKNRPEYQDGSLDDEFLMALAEGGFQVGALAQTIFSPGHMVSERGYGESLKKTSELLVSDDGITLFEAAIGNEAQFARVDVLVKSNSEIRLIEVKSKSFDSTEGNESFWKGKGTKRTITSEWEPYLLDIAFQTWIARKHLKTRKGKAYEVIPFLMLVDKTKKATVDGLNQMFKLVRDEQGRCNSVPKPGVTVTSIGKSVMALINVSKEVDFLLSQDYGDLDFDEYVEDLTAISLRGVKPEASLDSRCGGCEFRVVTKDLEPESKHGFAKCWNEDGKIKPERFDEPLIFELYQNRNAERHLEAGKFFLKDLQEADLLNKAGKETSYTARQRIQLASSKEKKRNAWTDPAALADIQDLEYPLHFIDFETCMTALPFNKGRGPYEQIAFQFSHHIAERDGSVRHANEFLNTTPGKFPNFDFVRALRKALGDSGGTVLRFSPYENTVLNQIRAQLLNTTKTECPDRQDLIDWIQSLTKPSAANAGEWEGERPFIDMMGWIKNGFFYATMNGSTSIKKVLPALLEWSPVLEKTYSKPIYGKGCGAKGGIESLNFEPVAWVKKSAKGDIIDPYKNLPPLFADYVDKQDQLFHLEALDNGAAALTAYQRLQFTEMSDSERTAINNALLRYCELDTLAMVMIWQALK